MPIFVNPKTGNNEVWDSKPIGYITLEQHVAERHIAAPAKMDTNEVRANLITELYAIDIASIRPLRAIDNGTDTQQDHQKLIELEQRAVNLRKQLSELSNE